MFPKPTKRKKTKAIAKKALSEYRKEQARRALDRDLGLCVLCYFRDDKKTEAMDVHHVWGRGQSVESSKESYKSLMCVCRACHPQPVRFVGGKTDWQLSLLVQANAYPINKSFKHEIS